MNVEEIDEMIEVKKAARTILDALENIDDLYIYQEEIGAISQELFTILFPLDDFEKVSFSENRCKYVKYDNNRKELLIQWTDFLNVRKKTKIDLLNLIYNILLEDRIDNKFLDRLRRLAE